MTTIFVILLVYALWCSVGFLYLAKTFMQKGSILTTRQVVLDYLLLTPLLPIAFLIGFYKDWKNRHK